MGLSEEPGSGLGLQPAVHKVYDACALPDFHQTHNNGLMFRVRAGNWSDTLTEYQHSQNRLFTNLDAQNETHLNAQKQRT
jgi:hypothetical protein